ncbi:hypothetical protein BT69DRAFT_499462 [Atractiella rhizophila]|nr:hypothetical protein BT69DRAFT_499462 [Atractiella rhizophila]
MSTPNETHQPHQRTQLLDLPPELLLAIFLHVSTDSDTSFGDICLLSTVCKSFGATFEALVLHRPIWMRQASNMRKRSPARLNKIRYLVSDDSKYFFECMELLQELKSCRILELSLESFDDAPLNIDLLQTMHVPSFGVSLHVVDIVLKDPKVPDQVAQWIFGGLRMLPRLRHLYIICPALISDVSSLQGNLSSLVITKLSCKSWCQVLRASFATLADLDIGESECISHIELDLLLKGCHGVERLFLRFTSYRSLPPLPRMKWLYLQHLGWGSGFVPLEEMVPHLGVSRDLKVLNLDGFQMADDVSQLAPLQLQQMDISSAENIYRIIASCVLPGVLQALALNSFQVGIDQELCHSIIPSCRSSLVVLELPSHGISVDLISILVDCQCLTFLRCLTVENEASEWMVQADRIWSLRYLVIRYLENLSPLITSGSLRHLHGLCINPEAMSTAWRYLADFYAFELKSASKPAHISQWRSHVLKPLVARPFQILSAHERL